MKLSVIRTLLQWLVSCAVFKTLRPVPKQVLVHVIFCNLTSFQHDYNALTVHGSLFSYKNLFIAYLKVSTRFHVVGNSFGVLKLSARICVHIHL